MSKTVGYARLSTADQADGETLNDQIQRLRDAGANEIFSDIESGAKNDRKEYQRMLELVRRGEIDKVLAVRPDRLSRNLQEHLALAELFSDPNGPQLETLEQKVDLTNHAGQLMYEIMGAFGSFERKELLHKTGLAKQKRKARRQPDNLPFGLRLANKTIAIPDTSPFLGTMANGREWSKADIAREAFAQLESTLAPETVRKGLYEAFGLAFQRGSILRWLLNPTLRGAFVASRKNVGVLSEWGEIEENAFPDPLINSNRHKKIERHFRATKAQNQLSHSTKRKHPLSGKIFCAHCNRRLQIHVQKNRFRYQCVQLGCNYTIKGKRRNHIGEEELIDRVLDHLVKNAEKLSASLKADFKPDNKVEREIEDLEKKRQQYLQLQSGEKDDAIAASLISAIETIDKKIAAAHNKTNEAEEDHAQLTKLFSQLNLVESTPEELAKHYELVHTEFGDFGKAKDDDTDAVVSWIFNLAYCYRGEGLVEHHFFHALQGLVHSIQIKESGIFNIRLNH